MLGDLRQSYLGEKGKWGEEKKEIKKKKYIFH